MTTFAEARAILTGAHLDIYEALLTHGPRSAGIISASLGIPLADVESALEQLERAHHIRPKPRPGKAPLFQALSATEARAAFDTAHPPAPPRTTFPGQQTNLFSI